MTFATMMQNPQNRTGQELRTLLDQEFRETAQDTASVVRALNALRQFAEDKLAILTVEEALIQAWTEDSPAHN